MERRTVPGGSDDPVGIDRVIPRLLAEADRLSFPRSPWECRPGRSAAPCDSDDAERRRRHSHAGAWDRGERLSSGRFAPKSGRVRRGVSLFPQEDCEVRTKMADDGAFESVPTPG